MVLFVRVICLKKIDLKRLNISAWLIVISTYLLPFREYDGFETSIGYPISFISVHDVPNGSAPFSSMYVNVLALLLNVVIVYIILNAITLIWKKYKKS